MLTQYSWNTTDIIVKITNLVVCKVTRNSENCNLIGRVGCYDCMVIYK